jgi:geranylgeranyl diphosphate synthase type II
LSELRRRIDASLADFLSLPAGCPPALGEAMAYSCLAPGKRFRPLLTLLAADACGATESVAMPAACAVEMIHAYSLVHDDLPSMDDDDFRRGRPTCHKRFGEALAILAGDALLTLAFEVLAKHIRPAEIAGRCCGILAAAAGACQLVGGQADDVDPSTGDWSIERLESIHRRKTGALISAALRLGATVARANPEQQLALETFGNRLGLAFQIADDLLDIAGESEVSGSAPRRDEMLGKLTFPALLGVPASADRLRMLVDEAADALRPFGSRAATLQDIARSVWQRAQAACEDGQ